MAKAEKISRNSRVAITPFDRHCWGYGKSGLDPTAIATIMNASPEEVTAAIAAVEKWKATNSTEMVVASMNEQALIAMAPVGEALAEAQYAKRLVSPAVINPKTGEVIREAEYAPDYATQIAATEAVARIVESVKERGPGVQVNVGGQHAHINGGGRSFEERLRIQREARGIRDTAIDVSMSPRMGMENDDELEDELEDEEPDEDE